MITPFELQQTQERLARNRNKFHALDSLPSERLAQGLDPALVESKFTVGQERKLHDQFEGWCRIMGVIVIHSRMDRKTSQACGVPDFVCLRGTGGVTYGCCLEFKAHEDPAAHMSLEQKDWRDTAAMSNVDYLCTNDLSAAIAFTKQHLNL